MAFCANCGAPVDGRFCAKCGAPVDAGLPYAGAPQAIEPAPSAGLAQNTASALCYVLGLVTGILFLILQPYNRDRVVRFHAFQSIFLNVAWFVVATAVNMLFGIMRVFFLTPVVQLAFFALWIYMIVVTYQGRMVVLPVIGPLAQQQSAQS